MAQRIVIGSIDLDTTPARRGDITLEGGRLMCDGNDISQRDGYESAEQARADVMCMYDAECWGLVMATHGAE